MKVPVVPTEHMLGGPASSFEALEKINAAYKDEGVWEQ
jgi:hypothetical protein